MIHVRECVICSQPITKNSEKKAVVAPFLAGRIWGSSAFPASLLRCEKCDFSFFTPRMEDSEIARLYQDYRGTAYQKQRHSYEPWYTESFNRGLSSEAAFAGRVAQLQPVLGRLGLQERVKRVLDFGGDRGQLVSAAFPNAECYVYDISGVEPLPGVTAIPQKDELRQLQFDLIVTSNLFEHVSFPLQLNRDIDSIAGSGTLIFHEVPCEAATGGMTLLKRIVQSAILIGMRPAIAARMLRPGMFTWMHEHVNYFSVRALETMVNATGWKVLAADTYALGDGPRAGKMVWCLAQKP